MSTTHTLPQSCQRGNDLDLEVCVHLVQPDLLDEPEKDEAELAGRVVPQGLGQRGQVLVLAVLGEMDLDKREA